MGFRRILITPELLRQWVPLPESTAILGSNVNANYIEVAISDETFSEVDVETPIVEPFFDRDSSGVVKIVEYKERG